MRGVEQLEPRLLLAGDVLSPAFELIELDRLRREFPEIDGSGIGIAIIDTGVDGGHQDLTSTNIDFVYPTTGNYVTNPHGTHVAGIAASSNPNIGVAFDADIFGLQVFTITGKNPNGDNKVGADNKHIHDALDWVLLNHEQKNIKVVNMSLGAGYYSSFSEATSDYWDGKIEILIRALDDEGVTVVSAAGNSYGVGSWLPDTRNGKDWWGPNFEANSSSPGIYSTIVVGSVWEDFDKRDIGSEDCSYFFPRENVLYAYQCDLNWSADDIVNHSQRPNPIYSNVVPRLASG